VAVTGAVHHPKHLSVDQLNAMPQRSREVAFGIGAERASHTFRGALLLDVLNAAGPAVNPKVKSDLARFVITVVGADGYAAALAWGEIDPNLENKTVLLATSEAARQASQAPPRQEVAGGGTDTYRESRCSSPGSRW
jgi:hypothetical protein